MWAGKRQAGTFVFGSPLANVLRVMAEDALTAVSPNTGLPYSTSAIAFAGAPGIGTLIEGAGMVKLLLPVMVSVLVMKAVPGTISLPPFILAAALAA
jgi:hypothetical protein